MPEEKVKEKGKKISAQIVPVIALSVFIACLCAVLTINIFAIRSISKLKSESQASLDDNRARVIRLTELKDNAAANERKMKRFSDIMPEKATQNEIYIKADTLAEKYGLVLQEIKFEEYQPEAGVTGGVLAYTLVTHGGYGDTMSMLSEFCGRDRVIQLKQLKFASPSNQDGMVQSIASIVSYYSGEATQADTNREEESVPE